MKIVTKPSKVRWVNLIVCVAVLAGSWVAKDRRPALATALWIIGVISAATAIPSDLITRRLRWR